MKRIIAFTIILIILVCFSTILWNHKKHLQNEEVININCEGTISDTNISNLTRVAEFTINPRTANFDADNILTIVAGNANVYLLHFGTETIRLQRVHHLNHGFAQTQISPNESYFVTTSFDAEDPGDADSRVQIWEMPELDRLHEIHNNEPIFNPVFNSDESLLAYQQGFPPSEVIVIGLDTFEVVTSFRGSYPMFDPLNPDNIAYITNEGVELRSITSEAIIGQLLNEDKNDNEYDTITISSDGQFLISWGPHNSIDVWNMENLTLITRIEALWRWNYNVVFSNDNRLLAVSGSDDPVDSHIVEVWDTLTWTLQQRLNGHENRVFDMNFSRDANLLATRNYSIHVWDIIRGQELELNTLANPQNVETIPMWVSILFSPDGRFIITADRASTLNVWCPSVE